MSLKKIAISAALAASAVAVAVGGSTLASADTTSTTSAATTYGAAGDGAAGDGTRGGSADTAVTGAELSKVTAAMTAKDSAVTVTEVRQDPDGSYDVMGTKAGTRVAYDVSADLATFTARTGGGGRGHGGDGGTGTGTGSTSTASPSASA